MSNSDQLVPTGGMRGLVHKADQRGLTRELSTTERSRALAEARIEAHAEIQSLKAQAVGYVGQQGMQAVAMVSQLEGQLAQACPMAVTRLQGIGDMTAMAIAQVVIDTAWKLH
jgi:hypothetical protein